MYFVLRLPAILGRLSPAVLAAVLALLMFNSAPAAQNDFADENEPDETEASDVIIELPEVAPDSEPRGYYSGGVPLIAVLPFYVTAQNAETVKSLSYGIAARIVDDFYPISAVRTVPLDRLVKLFPEILVPAPPDASELGDVASRVFDTLGAVFVITGEAELRGTDVRIKAAIRNSDGGVAAEISAQGELAMLPGLLSKLSFDSLTVAKAALTDGDRSYLEYVEPYPIEAWLKCQYGLSVAATILAGQNPDKKTVAAARRALGEALKLAPSYLRAREALGVIEYQTGNLKDAESAFREIVTRNPDYSPARFYLGAILFRRGAYDAAKKELTSAVELNKSDAPAWLFLGRTHLALGQPMMAEQAVRRSLDIDPSNTDAFFALGMTLLKQDLNMLAAEAFSEVVIRKPGLAAAQYNLGLAYFRASDYEQAAKHFGIYIELTPGDEFGDHEEVMNWIEEIETALRRRGTSGAAAEIE